MNLDNQVQLLLENAPADASLRQAMARAIAPVLKSVASQRQHLDYFVIRGRDRGLLVTTLANRALPQIEKRVVYAFANERDARAFPEQSMRDFTVESLPVIHILFQIFALDQVDSLVFMETSGDRGVEVPRAELQKLVRQQLQKFKRDRQIPPDFA